MQKIDNLKKEHSIESVISDNDQILTETRAMANAFIKFFSNIGNLFIKLNYFTYRPDTSQQNLHLYHFCCQYSGSACLDPDFGSSKKNFLRNLTVRNS